MTTTIGLDLANPVQLAGTGPDGGGESGGGENGGGSSGSAPAAPVQSIGADGWTASYPDPPAGVDPEAAPEEIAVTRAGFAQSGAATQVTDTVTVMTRLRQPYPDQGSLTADRVVLSDFIHQGDTIAGVDNGSTLAAPLPIACWLTPDLGHATGPQFTVRLAVAHAFARGGQPVAAVRFIVSDGTTEVAHLVSTMTSRQFASGLHAPYFEAALDLSGLAAGTLCTVDAVIYPWVGAAFRISAEASAYPSINLTVLKFLNDRDGGFGAAYAYVDAGAGSDGSGAVAATPESAAASPFATVAAAALAIRSFNAAHYGRDDTAGGTIRLVAGTHVHGNFAAATSGVVPLVIEAADPGARAATVYCDSGANASNSCPARLTFRNLTLRKTGGSVVFLDNGATLATLDRMMTFDQVTVDRNGTSDYAAWIYRVGRLYLNEVDGDAGLVFDYFAGNATKEITAVGCAGGWTSRLVYNAVACRLGALTRVPGYAQIETGTGQLISHSTLHQPADGQQAFKAQGVAIGARGLALVGSVLEQSGGLTAPALSFHADNDTFAVQNALAIGITVVGARTNWLYNDSGTAGTPKRGVLRFALQFDRNSKSDVFGQNANLTGNWSVIHNVGGRANVAIEGAMDGYGTPGPGHWLGEVAALGDRSGTQSARVVTDFADDRSAVGSGTGGGDYTPGPANALPVIPAGLAPYPIDLMGRAVANDGTARVGAIQPA